MEEVAISLVGEDSEECKKTLSKMPRPRCRRRIHGKPNATYFKPAGVRVAELNEIVLNLDEFEAIRLVDVEEIDQISAAKKMDISQPTFSRLLSSGRKKIANAVVKGNAIRLDK